MAILGIEKNFVPNFLRIEKQILCMFDLLFVVVKFN